MKPLEKRTLHWIHQDHVLEHMLRLWKAQNPSIPVNIIVERLSFDLATEQFAVVYGPGFRLDGFVTWWRINEVVLGAVQKLGEHTPADVRFATVPAPSHVFVSCICTRPERRRLVNHLARVLREENPDCREFIWIDQATGELKTWERPTCH